ncbi:MAG TPA: D-alanyl-D-alanine carboxypeptidase family protein [Rhizomicrobium sp.]|nr:D-alanyl-D-alanine carboxypeptidase family protein [Rhizomicrobium sp.]
MTRFVGLFGGLLLLLCGSTAAESAAIFCDNGPHDAAAKNAHSLETLAWTPLGRPETGWETYAPSIVQEVGTGCHAASPAFAAALGSWQAKHNLAATGVLDPASFALMRQLWEERRPFVALSHIACPPPPDESKLAIARADESYGGKTIELLPGALDAYRKMVAAARAELLAARMDPRLLTIFSGYRSPAYDAARCAHDQNCQGLVRASCSAHRTGRAMDVFLGAAPGFAPDSSADANRLYLSRTPVYRWLVYNAWRFGFVNYIFEPWHWEWTGEHSQ